MWVLTAAHCLHDKDTDDLVQVEAVKVVVGDHVTDADDPSEREYFPKQFLLHEDFNHTTMDNDIALIELTEAIEYNEVIAPVCLPISPPPVGERCTTTGWGLELGNGNRLLSATRLNELTSPIISNEVCGFDDYWGDHVTLNTVCAGSSRHGACVGDSGGPLVCNNNAASPYTLVGVTSRVPPHCRNPDGTKPTVFTNVYNYLDWIQTTTLNCTGYIPSDNGHCYKFVNEWITYTQAEEHCQAEGSYLVEIGSQMEQYFLQGLIGDNDRVWIGLQDKDQNGNWSHWNSGAPVEYSNWGDDQPDNYRGVQNCAELVSNWRWNGKWNDGTCDWGHQFVCERGSNQASDKSRKCYSYHREEKNYVDARLICTSEGGYLVEINSEWEQMFVYGMTDGSIWLGLNDLHGEGNWTKWNSGAPVTYNNWLSGEPDNGKGVNCGVMLWGKKRWGTVYSKWEVTMGGLRNQFICEQRRHTSSFSRADPVGNCWNSPNCCLGETCYKYHYEEKDCLEAQGICAAEGGYLVEINTEEEQVLLNRWGRGQDYWIGLSDTDEQGNWTKWDSGAPVTYTNWYEGERNIENQNIKEAEHCAEMKGRNSNYHWNYLKCDTERWFVCENTRLTTSSKDVEVVCSDSG